MTSNLDDTVVAGSNLMHYQLNFSRGRSTHNVELQTDMDEGTVKTSPFTCLKGSKAMPNISTQECNGKSDVKISNIQILHVKSDPTHESTEMGLVSTPTRVKELDTMLDISKTTASVDSGAPNKSQDCTIENDDFSETQKTSKVCKDGIKVAEDSLMKQKVSNFELYTTDDVLKANTNPRIQEVNALETYETNQELHFVTVTANEQMSCETEKTDSASKDEQMPCISEKKITTLEEGHVVTGLGITTDEQVSETTPGLTLESGNVNKEVPGLRKDISSINECMSEISLQKVASEQMSDVSHERAIANEGALDLFEESGSTITQVPILKGTALPINEHVYVGTEETDKAIEKQTIFPKKLAIADEQIPVIKEKACTVEQASIVTEEMAVSIEETHEPTEQMAFEQPSETANTSCIANKEIPPVPSKTEQQMPNVSVETVTSNAQMFNILEETIPASEECVTQETDILDKQMNDLTADPATLNTKSPLLFEDINAANEKMLGVRERSEKGPDVLPKKIIANGRSGDASGDISNSKHEMPEEIEMFPLKDHKYMALKGTTTTVEKIPADSQGTDFVTESVCVASRVAVDHTEDNSSTPEPSSTSSAEKQSPNRSEQADISDVLLSKQIGCADVKMQLEKADKVPKQIVISNEENEIVTKNNAIFQIPMQQETNSSAFTDEQSYIVGARSQDGSERKAEITLREKVDETMASASLSSSEKKVKASLSHTFYGSGDKRKSAQQQGIFSTDVCCRKELDALEKTTSGAFASNSHINSESNENMEPMQLPIFSTETLRNLHCIITAARKQECEGAAKEHQLFCKGLTKHGNQEGNHANCDQGDFFSETLEIVKSSYMLSSSDRFIQACGSSYEREDDVSPTDSDTHLNIFSSETKNKLQRLIHANQCQRMKDNEWEHQKFIEHYHHMKDPYKDCQMQQSEPSGDVTEIVRSNYSLFWESDNKLNKQKKAKAVVERRLKQNEARLAHNKLLKDNEHEYQMFIDQWRLHKKPCIGCPTQEPELADILEAVRSNYRIVSPNDGERKQMDRNEDEETQQEQESFFSSDSLSTTVEGDSAKIQVRADRSHCTFTDSTRMDTEHTISIDTEVKDERYQRFMTHDSCQVTCTYVNATNSRYENTNLSATIDNAYSQVKPQPADSTLNKSTDLPMRTEQDCNNDSQSTENQFATSTPLVDNDNQVQHITMSPVLRASANSRDSTNIPEEWDDLGFMGTLREEVSDSKSQKTSGSESWAMEKRLGKEWTNESVTFDETLTLNETENSLSCTFEAMPVDMQSSVINDEVDQNVSLSASGDKHTVYAEEPISTHKSISDAKYEETVVVDTDSVCRVEGSFIKENEPTLDADETNFEVLCENISDAGDRKTTHADTNSNKNVYNQSGVELPEITVCEPEKEIEEPCSPELFSQVPSVGLSTFHEPESATVSDNSVNSGHSAIMKHSEVEDPINSSSSLSIEEQLSNCGLATKLFTNPMPIDSLPSIKTITSEIKDSSHEEAAMHFNKQMQSPSTFKKSDLNGPHGAKRSTEKQTENANGPKDTLTKQDSQNNENFNLDSCKSPSLSGGESLSEGDPTLPCEAEVPGCTYRPGAHFSSSPDNSLSLSQISELRDEDDMHLVWSQADVSVGQSSTSSVDPENAFIGDFQCPTKDGEALNNREVLDEGLAEFEKSISDKDVSLATRFPLAVAETLGGSSCEENSSGGLPSPTPTTESYLQTMSSSSDILKVGSERISDKTPVADIHHVNIPDGTTRTSITVVDEDQTWIPHDGHVQTGKATLGKVINTEQIYALWVQSSTASSSINLNEANSNVTKTSDTICSSIKVINLTENENKRSIEEKTFTEHQQHSTNMQEGTSNAFCLAVDGHSKISGKAEVAIQEKSDKSKESSNESGFQQNHLTVKRAKNKLLETSDEINVVGTNLKGALSLTDIAENDLEGTSVKTNIADNDHGRISDITNFVGNTLEITSDKTELESAANSSKRKANDADSNKDNGEKILETADTQLSGNHTEVSPEGMLADIDKDSLQMIDSSHVCHLKPSGVDTKSQGCVTGRDNHITKANQISGDPPVAGHDYVLLQTDVHPHGTDLKQEKTFVAEKSFGESPRGTSCNNSMLLGSSQKIVEEIEPAHQKSTFLILKRKSLETQADFSPKKKRQESSCSDMVCADVLENNINFNTIDEEKQHTCWSNKVVLHPKLSAPSSQSRNTFESVPVLSVTSRESTRGLPNLQVNTCELTTQTSRLGENIPSIIGDCVVKNLTSEPCDAPIGDKAGLSRGMQGADTCKKENLAHSMDNQMQKVPLQAKNQKPARIVHPYAYPPFTELKLSAGDRGAESPDFRPAKILCFLTSPSTYTNHCPNTVNKKPARIFHPNVSPPSTTLRLPSLDRSAESPDSRPAAGNILHPIASLSTYTGNCPDSDKEKSAGMFYPNVSPLPTMRSLSSMERILEPPDSTQAKILFPLQSPSTDSGNCPNSLKGKQARIFQPNASPPSTKLSLSSDERLLESSVDRQTNVLGPLAFSSTHTSICPNSDKEDRIFHPNATPPTILSKSVDKTAESLDLKPTTVLHPLTVPSTYTSTSPNTDKEKSARIFHPIASHPSTMLQMSLVDGVSTDLKPVKILHPLSSPRACMNHSSRTQFSPKPMLPTLSSPSPLMSSPSSEGASISCCKHKEGEDKDRHHTKRRESLQLGKFID